VLALSHQTGVTLAEVGFLLILFAGVWLVAAQIPALKMRTARTIVAGIALACAGVLRHCCIERWRELAWNRWGSCLGSE
jgi:hypothetical protein